MHSFSTHHATACKSHECKQFVTIVTAHRVGVCLSNSYQNVGVNGVVGSTTPVELGLHVTPRLWGDEGAGVAVIVGSVVSLEGLLAPKELWTRFPMDVSLKTRKTTFLPALRLHYQHCEDAI